MLLASTSSNVFTIQLTVCASTAAICVATPTFDAAATTTTIFYSYL